MRTHMPLELLAARLRARGLTVVIRAGAQGKSARRFISKGFARGVQAVVMHHTGSSGRSPSGDIAWIDGKSGSDPEWVVANAHIDRSGVVTLIASGPTYTEGSGGPLGLIPSGGANDVSFSYEIGGTTGGTYPEPQQDAALIAAQVTAELSAELWEWPDDPYGPWRLFTHFEWTDRKVDVGGYSRWSLDGGEWDFDAFRSDVARFANDLEETDMAGETRYFTTPASRTALWRSNDGKHAYRVEPHEWVALGSPAPERLTVEQARQFEFGVGLPHDLVGIA